MKDPEDTQCGPEGGESHTGAPGSPVRPDPTGGIEGAQVDGAAACDRPEDQGMEEEPLPGGAAVAATEDSTEEIQELYPS